MSSLLLLGATGYIGGAVLLGLKSHYPDIKVTALVRSEKNVEAVQAAGADTVILGTHQELEKIRAASVQVDIVVNAADSDDLPLTRAVISGLRNRAKTSPSFRPVLLHTSGTGVIMDSAKGNFTKEAEKIWNDNNEDDIRSIDKSKIHRLIDLEIFQADEQGDISAYIIAPSTIYGVSKGPVNKISQQIPSMIRAAIRRKQTVYIGEGTNVWNNVHIDDLVDLYLLVFNLALSGTDKNTSYGKFYFGSVSEHVWGDVARDLAPLLHKKGLVDNAEAKSVSKNDEPRITATNSRSVAERGFALGWKPKAKSLKDTLGEDIDATLAPL